MDPVLQNEIMTWDSWHTNIGVKVVCGAVYSLIFIFGSLGNLWIAFDPCRDAFKWTLTNALMTNFAVANILFCLLVSGISIANVVEDRWAIASYVYQQRPFAHFLISYGSMLILTSIAVNRYSTIAQPLKPRKMMWIVIMVLTWLVSIAVSLPSAIFEINVNIYENPERFLCLRSWPLITTHEAYHLSTFVLFLVVPIIITASFYIALSVKMSRMSTPDNANQMADERRTNRLLIAMTIAFCICWMPLSIFQQIMNYQLYNVHWKVVMILGRVIIAVAYSWTCVVPLFYMWLNKITIKQFCLIEEPVLHIEIEVMCNNEVGVHTHGETQNNSRCAPSTLRPLGQSAAERVPLERNAN